jgi:hypothetical protein
MPNKRSRRKQTLKVQCPYCERRLWRMEGEKHYVFYTETTELQEEMNLTHKKASLVTGQPQFSSVVDRRAWLEEFFCNDHGKMWMKLKKGEDQVVEAKLASQHDWKRSTKTPHPDRPNPSVSEFSLRMSRRTNGQAFQRFYE